MEQLTEIKRPVFTERVARAFELLEKKCAEGNIKFYGIATWNGFLEDPGSKQYLSIDELYRIAIDVAGAQNRFKFIQLPINLAMPEAFFIVPSGVAPISTDQTRENNGNLRYPRRYNKIRRKICR